MKAHNLKDKLSQTVEFIKSQAKAKPEIAIILGTGLGALTKEIKGGKGIAYCDIPHFPISTTYGHKGELVLGEIGVKGVVAMEGRFHYYEGYTADEITYPVRVMAALGAQTLIVSNAAGGMNPHFAAGDLMIITDHINLMGVNPLIGPNDESLGPRFPDMCCAYDKSLVELAHKIALEENIKAHKGVYVAVSGPNLETPAEYRFLRLIGADCVGMSTVPEVIVAIHSGLRVLGISCITDRCIAEELKPVDIEEILKVAKHAEPKLTKLLGRIIAQI